MKGACIVVCLLLLLLPMELHGLKCYVCNTATDTDCTNDKVASSAHSTTCSALTSNYCMKTTLGSAIGRSCASACVNAMVGGDGTACCTKDDCNSSTQVNSSLLLLLLPLISIFVGKCAF